MPVTQGNGLRHLRVGVDGIWNAKNLRHTAALRRGPILASNGLGDRCSKSLPSLSARVRALLPFCLCNNNLRCCICFFRRRLDRNCDRTLRILLSIGRLRCWYGSDGINSVSGTSGRFSIECIAAPFEPLGTPQRRSSPSAAAVVASLPTQPETRHPAKRAGRQAARCFGPADG
jgi:hypothetical protein